MSSEKIHILWHFRFKENDNIVVLCKSGKRALEASKKLVKSGYENVKVYFGGIEDWKENGGKVIYEKGKILYQAFDLSFR